MSGVTQGLLHLGCACLRGTQVSSACEYASLKRVHNSSVVGFPLPLRGWSAGFSLLLSFRPSLLCCIGWSSGALLGLFYCDVIFAVDYLMIWYAHDSLHSWNEAGVLVRIRSSVLLSLVGSVTICSRPWSLISSRNSRCCPTAVALGFNVPVSHTKPGKLKSPPISTYIWFCR